MRALWQTVLRTWREFAEPLSEKLVDFANLAGAGLIVSQFFSPQGFQWAITWLGIGLWVFFTLLAFILRMLKGGR